MARKRDQELDDCVHINFSPRTETQTLALEMIKNNDLTFLIGAAGSGKTHTAIAAALLDMQFYRPKLAHKLIITRPIVEAGEELGALPGEISDKVRPYMIPIYDCLEKIVSNSKKFISDKVTVSPLAYQRGVTFSDCIAILDEAQNCTVQQLLLFMTRLGNGGKLIICGDTQQTDIGRKSGLSAWVRALKGKPGIGFIEFRDEDIVRHPLVKLILANRPG